MKFGTEWWFCPEPFFDTKNALQVGVKIGEGAIQVLIYSEDFSRGKAWELLMRTPWTRHWKKNLVSWKCGLHLFGIPVLTLELFLSLTVRNVMFKYGVSLNPLPPSAIPRQNAKKCDTDYRIISYSFFIVKAVRLQSKISSLLKIILQIMPSDTA